MSPNCDERTAPPDMIVLHYTEIDEAAALSWLCNPVSRVSSHYLLREDGGVECLVPEEKRAWHAGVSAWEGVFRLNNRSIGIEIVNLGHQPTASPYPAHQIGALIDLIGQIRARWPVARRHVVGHSDVAPGRKIDPGEAFPWQRIADAGHALWVPPQSADGPFDESAFRAAAARAGYWTEPMEGTAPTLDALIDAAQRRHTPDAVGDPPSAGLVKTLEAFADATETDARL